MGTHWKKNFDYKFLGSYELEDGKEKTLTIARTGREDVMSTNGTKQNCFVAYFKESKKPMVLNKTNCKSIESIYGPTIEDWVNKRITIVSRRVSAFGTEVDALRIKKTKPKDQNVDYSTHESKLLQCKTVDELKVVYLSFDKPVQSHLAALKDKIKDKLK
jgi:hypothetical protein